MQRVLVTGGAGFLGSHVSTLLLSKGYEVVVFDDFSGGKMLHLEHIKDHPRLEIIHGDVRRPDQTREAMLGCKIIYHLAVLGLRQSIKQRHLVNHVIIHGTLNLLDLALEQGVELFVNCSSSEAYGTAEYVPMDENHPLRPETPYAAAKVAQDMFVHSFGRTYGVPWLTVRPFNMYGPNSHWQGSRGELIPRMIVQLINEQPLVIFGDGQQTRDFLYVEDAARAIVAAAECDACRGETMNMCTGRETTIEYIATRICEEFGRDPKEWISRQPPRPGDVRRHLGDCTKLRALTGIEASIEIDEGLHRTIEWIKSLPFDRRELLSQVTIRNWE